MFSTEKSNSGSQNSSSKSHARSAAIPHRKAKHNFIKASPYTQPVVGKKKETNIKGEGDLQFFSLFSFIRKTY